MRRCLLLLSLLGVSCDDDGAAAPQPVNAASQQSVLGALGRNVFRPTFRDFAAAAGGLQAACQAWDASKAAVDRSAAQRAFLPTMATWQRAELLQAGPAGDVDVYVGGTGGRDRIYSWPTTRPCGVDQVIVSKAYEAPDFFTATLVNVQGLDALEYLLFHEGPGNACPAPVDINSGGTWAALDPAEIDARRAAYAAVLAGAIASEADRLEAAWDPEEGGSIAALEQAGDVGSSYRTAGQALSEVFHGMLYVDTQLKDNKLGFPLGLDPACTKPEGCLDAFESSLSDLTEGNIFDNLRSLRGLLVGGDDPSLPGFDDLLREAGAGDLADELVGAVDDALSLVGELGRPIAEVAASDLEQARTIHTAIKRITDLLKSQFVTVLDLELPRAGAADND